MHKTIYDTNATMRLIGYQNSEDIDNSVLREIEDVVKARVPHIDQPQGNVKAGISAMAWDQFLLGYIYGKRAERARRAKKATQIA